MKKEEFKHHISEEIFRGRKIIDKLQTYEESLRESMSFEIVRWEDRVRTLFLIYFNDKRPEFISDYEISRPELWYKFKSQGIRMMEKKLSLLESFLAYPPDSKMDNRNNEELPYKIFVSHSSKDAAFVKALVDLLEFLGADSKDKLLCSSVTGYRIPVGENICDYIHKQFDEYKLFVIVIHSDNYYASPYSLNEMGAAWVLKSNIYSFLVEGFPFDKMKGVVNDAAIAIKVDSEEAKERLNELQNILLPIFKPQGVAYSRWEEKRDEFLNKVNLPKGYDTVTSEKIESITKEEIDDLFR